MSPFGPFYPQRLQAAVNHADRLVDLLEREDAGRAAPSSWAEAWIAGRAGEIARVLDGVTQDWRAGRRSEDEAAQAIEEYLWTLHEGMATCLGVAAPACCERPPGPGEEPSERSTTSIDSVERLLLSLEGYS